MARPETGYLRVIFSEGDQPSSACFQTRLLEGPIMTDSHASPAPEFGYCRGPAPFFRAIFGTSVAAALLAAVALVSSQSLAEASDRTEAVDMFLMALKHQGRNPALIRSGDISYSERSIRALTPDAGRAESDARHIADLEQLIKNAPSDIARETLKEELQEVRLANKKSDGKSHNQAEMIRRDTFIGNNPRRRSRQVGSFKTKENGVSSEQIIIGEYSGTDTSFVSRLPDARLTSLQTNFYAAPSIEYCGRARSPMAATIAALLLAGDGDHDTFTFSPTAIVSLKQAFAAIDENPELGAERVPHVVSIDTFEGREVFRVEYGMRNAPAGLKMQTRLLSLTIDPSRGYIVPLEEEYHDGQLVLRFESSDYRQSSKDGLWFPWHSKETHFQPSNGEVVNELEWHVTQASLNEPVDPTVFEILIPAGEEIDDFRSDSRTGVAYRTEQPVVLSAIAPRDLTDIPGIIRPHVVTGQYLPGMPRWPWFRRATLSATVGLLIVLAGIAIRRRRHS